MEINLWNKGLCSMVELLKIKKKNGRKENNYRNPRGGGD